MHIKFFYYSIILLIFLSTGLFSQTGNLDSLFASLKTCKDTSKVNVLNALAKEYQNSDPDIAFQYSRSGLTLAEKLNFGKGIAKNSLTLGAIYEKQNKPKEAREYFLLALKTQKELKDKRGSAAAAVNIGITYAEEGNFDKGRTYLQQAYEINKEINNKSGIASVLMNLGGTYERQKNWDKALEYYNESLTVSGNDGNMNDFTKCLSNIGYVYYARAEFNNAKPYLFKSINIADKIRNREILQTDYEILSDIFLNEKQFEKAYQYQSLFTKLKDSISKETNLKRLQELEGKYEAGKKQKEIELLNKEKEKQLLLSQEETKRKNEIILSIFIGLLITLVFSLLLFNRFRIIKKQKIIIEEKNKDITDSIRYAKRIQQSQLPTEKYITKNLDRLK